MMTRPKPGRTQFGNMLGYDLCYCLISDEISCLELEEPKNLFWEINEITAVINVFLFVTIFDIS